MKPFKILSREILFDSPYCPLEKHVVLLPNGKKTEWFVNTSGDAVIVIPVLKSGKILLQKNYKHGCRSIVTEFCAGFIDKGETPRAAALRELMEETGYTGVPHKVAEIFVNPTGSIMKYHYFLVTDCVKSGKQKLESAEQITLFLVPDFKKACQILTNPKTKTSVPAIAGLLYLEKFLEKKKK